MGAGEETHTARWSESAVHVEETYRVLDGTVLEQGVDAGGFGHIYGTRRPGIPEETMMVRERKGFIGANGCESKLQRLVGNSICRWWKMSVCKCGHPLPLSP